MTALAATAELGPEFRPTVARRAAEGAIEILDRLTGTGERALCVFWSPEHARRDLYAMGCRPEDGWEGVEIGPDEAETVLEGLAAYNGTRWVYVEPAPGAPKLRALMRPGKFVAMLRES